MFELMGFFLNRLELECNFNIFVLLVTEATSVSLYNTQWGHQSLWKCHIWLENLGQICQQRKHFVKGIINREIPILVTHPFKLLFLLTKDS